MSADEEREVVAMRELVAKLGRSMHGVAKQAAEHRDLIGDNSLLAGIAGLTAQVLDQACDEFPDGGLITAWLGDIETLARMLPAVDDGLGNGVKR